MPRILAGIHQKTWKRCSLPSLILGPATRQLLPGINDFFTYADVNFVARVGTARVPGPAGPKTGEKG